MKKIVAFYSKNGNCKALAQVLSDKYTCELFELKEVRARKEGFLEFMRCGREAFFGVKSKLAIDVNEQFAPYDEIIFVSPVWASNTVPAINTALNNMDFNKKKVTLFACQADPELKALSKIKKKFKKVLENRGGIYGDCYCVQGSPPGKEPFTYERFKSSLEAL